MIRDHDQHRSAADTFVDLKRTHRLISRVRETERDMAVCRLEAVMPTTGVRMSDDFEGCTE